MVLEILPDRREMDYYYDVIAIIRYRTITEDQYRSAIIDDINNRYLILPSNESASSPFGIGPCFNKETVCRSVGPN